MSKKTLIRKMEEFERQAKFDAAVTWQNKKYRKIGPNYKYIKKSIPAYFCQFFARMLAFIAGFLYNHFIFHLKIKGKENLKNIKSAILTCNHISFMDHGAVRKAVIGRKLFIVAAEFNNLKGFIGFLIRNGGVLHFPDNLEATKNFHRAVGEILSKNNYLLFFPEEALWWMYEKPRPFKRGAFIFAVQNNVPVIPMFFTFKIKNRKNKAPKKKAVLNILEPIYPDNTISKTDAIEKMQKENYQNWVNKYEQFYGKKLEFLFDGNNGIKDDNVNMQNSGIN